ncbi:MAG: hypothetical protein ACO1PI_12755 [Bacteroidota bacterium]
MNTAIPYIPFLTTLFSAYFFSKLFNHYRSKPSSVYLLWWTVGVLFYGLGTLVESIYTLSGWSEPVFKAWYILGALLGGAPLAQGTVHLLLKPKTAAVLSGILISIIVVAATLVVLSPTDYNLDPSGKLSGKVLVWSWIRLITPIINLYAFVFLVGGAIWSAWKYTSQKNVRFVGNIYIGIGGLLPGIGGSFSKFGYTEVLYVTEFLGLLLIYIGYNMIKKNSVNAAT